MNFEDLKRNVEGYVLDLPEGVPSLIGKWINDAIREAARRHNFQFMAQELSVETVEQERKLTDLPGQWKESRSLPFILRQDGSVREIEWAPSELEMLRMYSAALPAEGSQAPVDEGAPRYVLVKGDELQVFPFPDTRSDWNNGNYRLRLPYWAYPEPLESDSDCNWITEQHPFYVIFKAASEGLMFNREEQRGQFWAGKAEMQFHRARSEDKLATLPDSPVLVPKRGVRGTLRGSRL
jgi:hypothetical protein